MKLAHLPKEFGVAACSAAEADGCAGHGGQVASLLQAPAVKRCAASEVLALQEGAHLSAAAAK